MRAYLAKAIVRWNGRCLDASYKAYMRCTEEGWPVWYERAFSWQPRVAGKFIPLASWLDSKATGEQMVEEGWWG